MKKIAICGSMFFHKEMTELKLKLEDLGFSVHAPRSFAEMGIIDYDKYTQEEGKELKIKYDLIKDYFSKINESSAILVANYEKREIEGYIGGNTLLEMGFAYANDKDIFMINEAPELQYKAEIEAMQPVVIGDDLTKITGYYNNLPKVFLSSANEIKVDATSFSFDDTGYDFDVQGIKTVSNVSEQPMSIAETYEGASNRMSDLKKQLKGKDYEYLVSIESGLAKLHDNHNYFNVTVCLIENKSGESKVSIVTDLEFPKEMTDKLDEYPDLGVFVQKEYGSKFKDPFRYLSHGRLKRIDLLMYPVRNTILQFNPTKND